MHQRGTYYGAVAAPRYYVEGEVLYTAQSRKITDCAVACLNDVSCIGFNAKVNPDGFDCELVTSITALILSDELWTYYDAYVSTLVLQNNNLCFIYYFVNINIIIYYMR